MSVYTMCTLHVVSFFGLMLWRCRELTCDCRRAGARVMRRTKARSQRRGRVPLEYIGDAWVVGWQAFASIRVLVLQSKLLFMRLLNNYIQAVNAWRMCFSNVTVFRVARFVTYGVRLAAHGHAPLNHNGGTRGLQQSNSIYLLRRTGWPWQAAGPQHVGRWRLC